MADLVSLADDVEAVEELGCGAERERLDEGGVVGVARVEFDPAGDLENTCKGEACAKRLFLRHAR